VARRNYVKRVFRGSRKTAKKYGKAFWTRKGKYGRYVYRQGRRIAFEELGRFASKKARKLSRRRK
jgi:hypothetical protein